MIIYPAIDLLDGRCVRLYKGDYGKVTQYSDDPVKVAQSFEAAGATHVHVVDLDGAKSGKAKNHDLIKAICKNTSLLVQTGGGIRDMQRIEQLKAVGVDRIVLGTAAVKNPGLVKEAVEKFGKSIVVGIDSMNSMVAVEGWTASSSYNDVRMALDMQHLGVQSIVYTDIDKDGTLQGPNLKALENMIKSTGLDIVASGGIKDMQDIYEVEKIGAYAVITGKALYEGRITLEQLFEL